MTQQTERFVHKHFAGDVLKSKIAPDLPTKAEEIDLRFLNMLHIGDTYDGTDEPTDGVGYQAVIYGNQIAWEMYADYVIGSCEQRHKAGNELYRRMYHVGQLYLKIQAIGRALFFGGRLKKGVETFYVNEKDLEILENHPQWKEMVMDFSLELVPTKEKGYYKIVVSKSFDPKALES